jgi:hypothetical protein
MTRGTIRGRKERMGTMKTRKQILEEAQRIRTEIDQIVIDAEAWNRHHPSEKPINPDPVGVLARLRKSLPIE